MTTHKTNADRVLWLLIAACALGAGGGLLAALATVPFALTLVGLVAVVVVARWPSAVVGCVLVACQDIPRDSGFGAETRQLLPVFGGEVYSAPGGVPVLLVLLLIAACAGLVHAARDGGINLRSRRGACILLAGAATIAASAIYQSVSPLAALGGFARPYLEAALALIVAATTGSQPGRWRLAGLASASTLMVLSAAAALAVVTGNVDVSDDGSLLVFYDSATPALAAAAAVACIVAGPAKAWRWPLLGACIVIVVASGRRNVWLAGLVVLVVAALLHRERLRSAGRLTASVGISALLAAVVAPVAVSGAWDRLLLGVGSAGDESTAGHVADINIGWRYALDRPITGYGPAHGPLPGTVAQSDTIYVHNSYLLEWLRFGAIGIVVLTSAGIAMFVIGARGLRRGRSVSVAAAGSFLIIAPISAFSAAFLTTTQHWPALIGAAVGLLLCEQQFGSESSRDVDLIARPDVMGHLPDQIGSTPQTSLPRVR